LPLKKFIGYETGTVMAGVLKFVSINLATRYEDECENSMRSSRPLMVICGLGLSQLESSLKAKTTMDLTPGNKLSIGGELGLR
jgi:hypothetical protein